VRLAHRLDGPSDAPVLVLSNSLGSTWRMWDGQLSALTEHFRVLRYEHRGHGGSEVADGPYAIADIGRDLLGLLDELGIARVSLAGLSLGGMTGMWLAAHEPSRVDRLALLCTSALFGPPTMWQERAELVRAKGTEAIVEGGLRRWLTEDFIAAEPATAQLCRQMMTQTSDEGYAGCCEAIAAMDLRPDLAAITAPTLVIAGADDPATPPSHAEVIAAGIRGADLHVVPHAAHLATIEQPAVITGLLLRHFRPERATATNDRDRCEAGMATRREVLGAAHVDRAVAATTEFTADFQDFITRYAWGEVWNRDGIDRRTRSCITLAVLTALRAEGELGMHVKAALRNGLTPAEISEVLLHTAIYAGVPAANSAFGIAREAIAEFHQSESTE